MRSTLRDIMDDEAFCARVRDELVPLIWSSTVPIFVEQDNAIRQSATGTLLRIGDRRFLVTAAHMILDAKKYGVTLRARSRESKATLMPLIGRFIHISSSGEDFLDLALMELTPETAKVLGGYQAVGLIDIDKEQESTKDLYIIAGFPCELSQDGTTEGTPVALTQFFGFTYPYPGPAEFRNYDARHHILLDARRHYAETVVGQGRAPESFIGISGCTIWKTNATHKGQENWKAADAKIHAVQTMEYSDTGVFRGTKWFHIARAIHQEFPELRPSLGLELP